MFAAHLQSIDTPINAIQIWKAPLDSLSTEEIATLEISLDPSERLRAERFHFEQDRKHYIGSRGLLRHLIAGQLNVAAATLTFEYGEHGKPALTAAFSHDKTLCFNLSHSAGWAMFALAWDREVGIDLESNARLQRDHDELLGLATRILSERELAVWKALPNNAAREAAFLRGWTRKEAYAKARGEGLFANLTLVEVILDAAAPNSSLILHSSAEEEGARDWILHDLSAPDGFAAAVAVAHK
jgi:4'-phosphopantetheinyl transferase